MTYRIESVVIQLPSHDLVRIYRTTARGVCADGTTWDGTLSLGNAAREAIADVRARLFDRESDHDA